MEESLGSHATVESKDENQRISKLREELKKFQVEQEKLLTQSEEKDSELQNYKQKIAMLQEDLANKESAHSVLEERYKTYVEKAKSVIKALDPKQFNILPSELQILRNQNLEKQKTIDDLSRFLEKQKLIREMEEKLMLSAFYNFGLTCQ